MHSELLCTPPEHNGSGTARPARQLAARRARRWLAAACVLAAAAGNTLAAEVRVSITTGESGRPPVVTGNDFDGAQITDGSRRTGSAAFGGGSAAFDVAPQLGLMSLSGQSAPTSFAEWGALLRETIAVGQFEIGDRFRIEGPIVGTVAGVFVARVSAELLPALAFEQAFLAARGEATFTTSSRTLLLLAQHTPNGVVGENRLHDQVGSWLGTGTPCACTIGTDLDIEFEIPLEITDDSREFLFNLNTASTGRRGGGFAYGGADTGATRSNFSGLRAGQSALGAPTGGDPMSALSFELRLPAGLSVSSDGANYLRLAAIDPPPLGVPEPAPWSLLLAAGAAALARPRRAGCGAVAPGPAALGAANPRPVPDPAAVCALSAAVLGAYAGAWDCLSRS